MRKSERRWTSKHKIHFSKREGRKRLETFSRSVRCPLSCFYDFLPLPSTPPCVVWGTLLRPLWGLRSSHVTPMSTSTKPSLSMHSLLLQRPCHLVSSLHGHSLGLCYAQSCFWSTWSKRTTFCVTHWIWKTGTTHAFKGQSINVNLWLLYMLIGNHRNPAEQKSEYSI